MSEKQRKSISRRPICITIMLSVYAMIWRAGEGGREGGQGISSGGEKPSAATRILQPPPLYRPRQPPPLYLGLGLRIGSERLDGDGAGSYTGGTREEGGEPAAAHLFPPPTKLAADAEVLLSLRSIDRARAITEAIIVPMLPYEGNHISNNATICF
jgi:hypothetical protein